MPWVVLSIVIYLFDRKTFEGTHPVQYSDDRGQILHSDHLNDNVLVIRVYHSYTNILVTVAGEADKPVYQRVCSISYINLDNLRRGVYSHDHSGEAFRNLLNLVNLHAFQ